ncbi:MAG: hypothetical protein PF638_02945 [Candidatus Delongbacteria bacterium]|jgi:hypothetical protein|nr:hypothetical protein [Candidatus Delongbacteria bacterium]
MQHDEKILLKKEDIPKYLYHYTSIEAFSQILKNKTIKFRKLSLMNDPVDGISQDYKNSQELVYCSSWTATSEESLPMWKLYTELKGLRFRLQYNLFKTNDTYFINKYYKCFKSKLEQKIEITSINGNNERKIYIEDMFGPYPVSYTKNNSERICSTVINMPGSKNFNIDQMVGDMVKISIVGLKKNLHWQFEEEWRYRLALSELLDEELKSSDKYKNLRFKEDELFLDIRPDAFKDIQILLGPKATDATYDIIEILCSKYIPDSKYTILRSEINIR